MADGVYDRDGALSDVPDIDAGGMCGAPHAQRRERALNVVVAQEQADDLAAPHKHHGGEMVPTVDRRA